MSVFRPDQYGRVFVPDVLKDFRDYHAKNPSWGSLHVVLDDGNYDKASVLAAHKRASDAGDIYGAQLASLLLQMTKTQMRNLSRMA